MEQATDTLTVIETVSKLQSMNPEYFPGKPKHSSHLSSMTGVYNLTSAHAGRAGATAHLGGRAALPAALPHPRDLLHVPSPAYFDPSAQSRNARMLFAPSWIEKHPTDLFFFFFNYAQGYFFLASSAHEGPAACPTPGAPRPHHPSGGGSPQAGVNVFASRQGR